MQTLAAGAAQPAITRTCQLLQSLDYLVQLNTLDQNRIKPRTPVVATAAFRQNDK